MSGVPTVPARFVTNLLEVAAQMGVRGGDLCSAVGIDEAVLVDPDAMITMKQLCAIYEEGAKQTKDDCFGLHVAERSKIDVPGHALLSSATLRQALEVLAPYLRAIHAGEETSITAEGEIARFTYRVTDPSVGLSRQRAEAYFGMGVRLSRLATGMETPPIAVSFQHSRPKGVAELERFFRAPLRFDQPANEVVFHASFLDMPLGRSDPGLAVVIRRHMREVLDKLATERTFTDDVRRAVAEGLQTEAHGLDAVAHSMKMSPRTLQRRLSEEGTSHQELLDRVREELSTRYLAQKSLSIKEVAGLLGYSELRAFYRAFKRWTGSTPAEHRKTVT